MPAPSPYAIALMMTVLGSIVGAWIWVLLRLWLGLRVLPPSTPRVVPWGAGSVLLAVVFWIALNASVPIAYQLAIRQGMPAAPANAGRNNARLDLKPGEMMTLSAVQNAATLALVPLILGAISGARPRDFGIVASGLGKQAARGLMAYPLLAPIVFGVMGLALLVWGRTSHPLEQAIVQDKSPGMVIVLILAGVVLAPAAEELIFRGVLLGWLTRLALGSNKSLVLPEAVDWVDPFIPARPGPHLLETLEIDSPEEAPGPATLETAEQAVLNPYAAPLGSTAWLPPEPVPVAASPRALRLLAANVAVSLLFAALHGPVWPTPIPIFFLSLGLGLLYQRTGGILAPIALHMTFNGVSTAMMFLLFGNGPAPKADPKPIDPVPPPALMAPRIPGHNRQEFVRSVLLTCPGDFDTVFYPNATDDVGSSIGADASAALGFPVPSGFEECLDPVLESSDKWGTRPGSAGFGTFRHDRPALKLTLDRPRCWLAGDRRDTGVKDDARGRGDVGPPRRQPGIEAERPHLRPPAILSGSLRSMSASNPKKTAPLHSGFEWAGTVARIRRGGKSSRAGRRSALLGVLTSVYANSSRGGRTGETRGGTDRA